MSSNKVYYKRIDLIRIFSCLAILLYHLNIIEGGYLAVCTFFVLSGYLTCVSAFKNERFSLKEYYVNKLKKIYLPLIIVVFMTIAIISFLPNIYWFNLKPETTSILFGYNNFWQLSAKMDYFSMNASSPFIHLWYISILMQFDIVFPFVFILLNKIAKKYGKIVSCIIATIISFVFLVYFYKMSLYNNVMEIYYNTFTRIFSLFFGLTLGLIHSYYRIMIPNTFKDEIKSKILFCIYLLLLVCLYITTNINSKYCFIYMIIVSLISLRLIDYSIVKSKSSIFDKYIKLFSNMSYGIYLFQYPVIFFFQKINLKNYFVIILLIFILSYLLYFCLSNRDKKYKIFRYIISSFMIFISIIGIYKYITAKDYTKDMKELENQLIQNEIMLQKNEENYLLQLKKENEDWLSTLENLENKEKELKDVVTNLPLVGIGDSVMLGAVSSLYAKFPNSYYDARVSRTAWEVDGVIKNLKQNNILGNPIVINLGTNGDCSRDCKRKIMNDLGDRNVFWINTVNYTYVNDELVSFAEEYDNLYVIDWYTISRGHPEYFIYDGIHLTNFGREAYTNLIYDTIYQIYLDEYEKSKNEIINEHNEKIKSKISFYGNDILLNSFDYLQNEFEGAKFIIDKNFNYELLRENIVSSIYDDTITYNLVFAFDSDVINVLDYQKLINICKDYKIYIVALNDSILKLFDLKYDNVKIINFSEEIKKNKNYLMADGIHLSNDGNSALNKILKENVDK